MSRSKLGLTGGMKSSRAGRASGSKVKLLLLAAGFAALAFMTLTYAYQQLSGSQQYLVAAKGIASGAQVSEVDFNIAEFDLAGSAGDYLKPNELPPGAYVLGPFRAGQLIPKSAIANAVIDDRVPVVVTSAMGLPDALQPGSSADVWVTPILENNSFGDPYLLVLAAEVGRLSEPSAVFADAAPNVELWVPEDAVAAVLKAQAGGSELSLVMRPTFAD